MERGQDEKELIATKQARDASGHTVEQRIDYPHERRAEMTNRVVSIRGSVIEQEPMPIRFTPLFEAVSRGVRLLDRDRLEASA